MISIVSGDIFNSTAQAIVNPVNCVGVCGAGLALEFKKRYPKNFEAYKIVCKTNELKPGVVHTTDCQGVLVINFPTKTDWRKRSKYEYIYYGLKALRQEINAHEIHSIAIPALGCGLGGLEFKKVLTLITEILEGLNCDVYVYGDK